MHFIWLPLLLCFPGEERFLACRLEVWEAFAIELHTTCWVFPLKLNHHTVLCLFVTVHCERENNSNRKSIAFPPRAENDERHERTKPTYLSSLLCSSLERSMPLSA